MHPQGSPYARCKYSTGGITSEKCRNVDNYTMRYLPQVRIYFRSRSIAVNCIATCAFDQRNREREKIWNRIILFDCRSVFVILFGTNHELWYQVITMWYIIFVYWVMISVTEFTYYVMWNILFQSFYFLIVESQFLHISKVKFWKCLSMYICMRVSRYWF